MFSFVLILALVSAAQRPLSTNCIDVLSNSSDYRSFIYALQRTRLIPFINKLSNCTLFAPVNAAFQNVPPHEITRTRLVYHILGSVRTRQMIQAGDVLESALVLGKSMGEHRGQRIKALATDQVGNIRLVKEEQLATNGVVHGVDGLLDLPHDLHTVVHTFPQLNTLRLLLDKAHVLDQLHSQRPFTLFAPSDLVLSNELSTHEHAYLTHPRGARDLALLTGHFMVSDEPVFGGELPVDGSVTVQTMAGQSIIVARQQNQLTVDGIPTDSQDWIASNGVIHVLSRLMKPTSLYFNGVKLMHAIQGTRFVDVLLETGLDRIVNDTTQAFTIFVPKNEAVTLSTTDSIDRCKYHIINQALTPRHGIVRTLLSDAMTGNVSLPLFTEVVDGQIVRVNGIAVQGSPVVVGNTTLYAMDGFLPTPLPVLDHLPWQSFTSIFTRALYLAQQDAAFKAPPGATYFIATDKAFRWLGLAADYLLMAKGDALRQLQHVVRGMLSTTRTVFTDELDQPVRLETVDGDVLRMYKEGDQVYIESPTTHVKVRVVTPDTPVRNGAIHYIDRIVLPPRVHITATHLLQGAGGNTFLDAIKRVGLSGLLDRSLNDLNAQGVTLLVPADDAFVGFNDTILYGDLTSLRRLILSHVIRGTVNATGTYTTLLANRKVDVEWTDYEDDVPSVELRVDGTTVHVERMGRAGPVHVFKISGLLLENQGWGWGWWLLLSTACVGAVSGLGVVGYKAVKARRQRRLIVDTERSDERQRLLSEQEDSIIQS